MKIHLMTPHDPKYAQEMSKDTFCPHITQAISMGLITHEQGRGYVEGTLSEEEHKEVAAFREQAKPAVYLSAYGGTWRALQLQTGWDDQRCKDAIDSYWDTNWSLEAVAKEQVVITDSKEQQWLVHPIVGILLNLRSDKDRFNTVCQGGGSFFHFNWIFGILNKQKDIWGARSITANMHDEIVISCKNRETFVNTLTEIIKESVSEVSDFYMLRRELGCDVQTGHRYSEIH